VKYSLQMSQHFSTGKGWASRSERFQPRSHRWFSAMVLCKNLRVGELWEVSHSEGDVGRSPLWSRRAQWASLRTAFYRVARQLTLVFFFFFLTRKVPSCPNSLLLYPRQENNVGLFLRLAGGLVAVEVCTTNIPPCD